MTVRYVIDGAVRAFAALEHLTERTEAGPTEIAKLLGVPKNSAFRVLQTLVAVGRAEATPHGTYRVVAQRQNVDDRLIRQRCLEAERLLRELREAAS